MKVENTRYGFIWNNLHVERVSEEKGGIYLYLCTDKEHTTLRITKGGKIKLYEPEKHLKSQHIDYYMRRRE